MPSCVSCHADLPDTSRFCASCGTPLPSDDMATAISTDVPPSPRPSTPPRRVSLSAASSASSAPSSGQARFVPGTVLAGRYRIIGLLGAGGMGEVYRADDLTLDQPIAIKFLPPSYSQNEDLLERFRNEVKIARKVSHPNVCRVYDVGETDGLTFLTMEYVDGEDLSILLRRIGRLPEDKALETARQICAGLAAAHAKGVLHRDLKPANVMLDGRGQAVIMDFGLAAIAEQVKGAEIRSGTPAYMAPEQLEGREVTMKSDIFSLGVMLFEIFTGKRPADGASVHVSAAHGSPKAGPQSHSTFGRSAALDPLTERVLTRCIDPDPDKRPPNVLAVAAALPGGDPLAAALAAGETPSPEMLVKAGEIEGLAPKRALAVLAVILVLAAVSIGLGVGASSVDKFGFEQPAVLAHQSRQIVAKLGYPESPLDSGYDFAFDNDLLDYVRTHDKQKPDWDRIYREQPAVAQLWYRQSLQPMTPLWLRNELLTPGTLQEYDPEPTVPGMVNLRVDMQGRLLFFQAIPAELSHQPDPPQPPDWSPAFAAAALDPTKLTPTAPLWHTLASSDTRAAWTGTWPNGRPFRVEAAALAGKIVFFGIVGDWTKPPREPANDQPQWLGFLITLGLNLLALFLAVRNYRLGRADAPAALRFATFLFVVAIMVWVASGHFVPGYDLTKMLQRALATALNAGFGAFLLYMGVEPYVRKLWPQAIIGLTRLLSGRVRDAMVARDVLYGIGLGMVWTLVGRSADAFSAHIDGYSSGNVDMLSSAGTAFAAALTLIPGGIHTTFFFFGGALLLRLLFHWLGQWLHLPQALIPWLVGISFTVLLTTLESSNGHNTLFSVALKAALYAIAAVAVTRFGLLALMVAVVVANGMLNVPITGDLRAWYALNLLVGPVLLLALTFWAFHASLGGRKLLPESTD